MSAFKAGYGNMLSLTMEVKHAGILSKTRTGAGNEGAGLIKRQPKRDTHRRRRPRKPLPGMMLHMDGSPHDWFKDSSEYTIVTLYDDANNYLYDIEIVREEDSFTCMNMIKTLVEKKGIFCSLYTDRASHFFLTKKAGDGVAKDSLTQIGRALGELGIHHIPSYSPQARGRSERLNQTLQGRIPQELRLRDIKTIDEANGYLKEKGLLLHLTKSGHLDMLATKCELKLACRDSIWYAL